MADDDTLITLEPEGETKETSKTNGAATDDALADLKSQFDEIQRGKQVSDANAAASLQREAQARQDAERARADAQAARTEAADTHLTAIETSLTAQQAARDAAKKSYKAAMESGNWDEAAEAQERLTTAVANITRLSDAKDQIETRRQTQRTEVGDDTLRGRQVDPVEAFIGSRTAQTQSWLRAHAPQAQAVGRYMAGMASAEESKLARKLIAADNDAAAEGIAVDTPEYFAHLESFVGLKKAASEEKPDNKQTGVTQVRAHQRRQSVPAAPVNGGGSPASGGSEQIQVRLTKGQAESAEDGTHVWLKSDLAAGRIKDASMVGKPIGVREMARRVHEMSKERPGIFENGNVDQ
jgi:hypothetical protein